MLSPVGVFLQILRTERGEHAKEMAEKIGVNPQFLSFVCNGKRPCPDSWYEKIPELYELDGEKRTEWIGAIIRNNQRIDFMLEKLNDYDKNVIMILANHIETLKPKEKQAILDILNGGA